MAYAGYPADMPERFTEWSNDHMSKDPNSSVYNEKKIAAYESVFKETNFAKPMEIFLTITVAHLFGQAYIMEQQGTKEGDPVYSRFVCPLEEITKIYINDAVKARSLFVQCDTNIKGVVHRKRIIIPCLENVEAVVKQIEDVRAAHMEKVEAAQKKELEKRRKALEEQIKAEKEKLAAAEAAAAEAAAGSGAEAPADELSAAPKKKSSGKAKTEPETTAEGMSDTVDEKPRTEKKTSSKRKPIALADLEAELLELQSLQNALENTPVIKATGRSKKKTAAETVPEPVVETAPEPEIAVEAVSEPEPAAEAAVEAAPEPESVPVIEVVSEPAIEEEPVPEPVVEAAPEPEPIVEAEPEPVVEADPEPVVEAAAEAAPEPVVEADPEPVVEAAAEAAPEPVVEAAPEAASEPVPASEQIIVSSDGQTVTLEEFQTAVRKLRSMKEEGLVSDEEYAEEKKKLLALLY